MALTKKEQYDLTKEMLYAKYNGACALCGYELGQRWHIWNINPIETIVRHTGELVLGDTSYDNKLPACVSCNSTRINHSHSKEDKIDIERFRGALAHEFDFLADNTYYKKALRYGVIEETKNRIVFHFEKANAL